jgi:hypothetical protein
MAILDRSAPSEVKAPPIAATLADIKVCSACEYLVAYIWLIFAGEISAPPKWVVCALSPKEESATAIAIQITLFIVLFVE